MKTLLLMRHAKSSWKHHDLDDIQRPLNKRGKKDAPMMGKLIRDKELVPQKILSSTAERARATAEAFIETSKYAGEVTFLDSFYLAEPQVYLDELHNLSDDTERVMVIGHNPGIEGVLQIVSGQVESLPTAAIAYLVLPIQKWSELTDETRGDLVELWRPHDLKEKSKK
jgi:phosphohistidine phosphatase